jgi:hypothetical protein
VAQRPSENIVNDNGLTSVHKIPELAWGEKGMGITVNANTGANGEYQVNQNGIFINGEKRQSGTTIFGGNLKPFNDPVEARRKQAQQKAMKVVQNAWSNDRTVDETIQEKRDNYKEMKALREEASASLKDVNQDKEVLQTLYGIEEDSEEQKNLELLEKEQDYNNGVGKQLTKEEVEQLEEIHTKPLTEYQTRALELNDQAAKFKNDINDAKRQMQDDVSDVKRIQQERLKSHPMVDAQKEAASIMDEANEEIKGMLVQDAVDHIDEVQEENEEKAKENEKKQEEKEEQLEKLEEKLAVQEALILQTQEAVEDAKAVERRNDAPEMEMDEMIDLTKISGSGSSKDVQQSLSDIKSSMKVLEADLKGIKVDEEV